MRLKGRLIAHNIRLGLVLDVNEHSWFNLTGAGDAQAAWYIKANLWVSGQRANRGPVRLHQQASLS